MTERGTHHHDHLTRRDDGCGRDGRVGIDMAGGDALAQVLRVLGAAKAHYRHPVRVLVMNVDGQCWPAGTQDLGRVTVIEWG